MNVLLVHNQYQFRGGEDSVVAREEELLKNNGVSTHLHLASNDDISGPLEALKTGLHVAYSKKSRDSLRAELRQKKPDVVHVHNFFPLLTPSIYDACLEAGVPVVQTLHNYRVTCSNALLLRNGKPCEDCITGSPYLGALHGCYRGSRLASLPVAHMIAHHRKERTWAQKVNRFIAPSRFLKDKLAQAGLPSDRISVKYNYLAATRRLSPRSGNTNSALYVGRISREKGLDTLLAAWSKIQDYKLRIAGTGPDLDRLRSKAGSNVEFLGFLETSQIQQEMADAAFVVVPSEWYEPFGLVVLESFAQGTSVLVSRMGALPELVRDGVDGLIFEAGDVSDLSGKALRLFNQAKLRLAMGEAARKAFEERFNPSSAFEKLVAIYKEAMK